MRIVIASYINSSEFNNPYVWLRRIKGYIGVLESLAKKETIISIEQINYTGQLNENGVEYHFLNYRKRRSFFPFRLNRFIKRLHPDVIIIHGLSFPLQIIQLRLFTGSKTKILAQYHADKPFTGYKKIVQKLADKCINGYLFTSKCMGNEWVDKHIISSSGKVYGIMVASSFFHPMDKRTALQKTGIAGHPVFVSVGRLNENKDPLTVIKAFLQFSQHQPDSRLYMIYHTEELLKEIQELLLTRSNNHSVILTGKIEHEELLYWYNSADFVISASHAEAGGIAVCEGMSCGCIPILSNILPFKKITGDGACGLLFEKGNVDSLTKALLTANKMNLYEERRKVLAQFNKDLSFDAIAAQTLECIKKL